jgi:hypothetical protein
MVFSDHLRNTGDHMDTDFLREAITLIKTIILTA